MSDLTNPRNYSALHYNHFIFRWQFTIQWLKGLELRTVFSTLALCFSLLCFTSPTILLARQAEESFASSTLKQLKPLAGFKLSIFAEEVIGARAMELTDQGDVIVSQPGSGMVSLLYGDINKDGASDGRKVLLEGLRRPHGLLLDGDWLYIALETSLIRYQYNSKRREVSGKPQMITDKIPAGGHSTRTIRKGPDGWLYLSIGSSCNVCIERHKWRATILRFQPEEILKGGEIEIYASGLRNSVGFDWQPGTDALFATDNGRDSLGDDLPPDEVNRIIKDGFYGWPFFYGNSVPDTEFGGRFRPDEFGKPIDNAHEFTAHVAPLSLRFLRQIDWLLKIPSGSDGVALVGLHGSWNRSVLSGYKVVMLGFGKDGKITQSDFLSGFLLADGRTVIGRPVDTLELLDGSVLISDDYGGVIWKMVPTHNK